MITTLFYLYFLTIIRFLFLQLDSMIAIRKPLILTLPDEIIYEILGYLNQINILSVRLINLRFYIVATEKLFNFVYVNNGDPVVIGPDVNSPFYLKYTVVNGWNKFITLLNMKELQFVNTIVIYTDYGITLDFKKVIRSSPRISIEFEYKKSIIVHQELSFSSWFRIAMTEFNYSIKKLTINGGETKLLPFFTRLKSLRIINGTSTMFDSLKQQITIRDLSLEFLQQPIRLIDIRNIFNLAEIVSLELKFGLYHPPPSVVELAILASQLKSVKQLAIISPNIRFDKVVHQLKPNSITSFYLKILGNYYETPSSGLVEILKYQQQSVMKVYWSCVRSNSRFRSYGLQEFDRVYKKSGDNNKLEEVVFLLNNGRFEKLNQVVLNENYFAIKSLRNTEIVCLN
ncbi:uncharacterized protein SPAPADRAFT_64786 [Spathaspora passalidarum NRRL Y-27907]|uniref:F-box domain-containing protein n=1 Tax=Spathaspora passalidarum (strain NRRL Y-27907 / 11-Y1) TaxID=619300 RepID=G3AES3_SPAPN|nr:uncharacterized protein SPAPADRAFT_64786 [Spathaspora passalidarum NRRL Y-27907]EGW35699.1 hypothetical protein SPAPADRAFT_64786 [Spathaspora passalidarum NRRL Y-27907]